MRRDRHPKITPLRALALLLDLEGIQGETMPVRRLADVKCALRNHVMAGLATKQRRARHG